MKIPFWPDFSGYRNIDFGLTRVYQLLERLDNPQHKLPPTIHIAGTNGKGSTLSFLKNIFQQAQLKVHTYTSPHLANFNERITICGKEIEDDFLSEILSECKRKAEIEPKINITFFEGITVAAFVAFSRIKADILLLETGMGGRLDATNILNKVLCSIITPISKDHTEFLGKTIAKIAFEKAGIIKKNCPVFIAKQKSSALKTIEKQALSQKSKTFIFNRDWKIIKKSDHFIFSGFNKKFTLPLPSLIGSHQIENASLAIAAAINQKKFKISEENIASAIASTSWPARLQKITSGKLYQILPKNCQLYLDGSHNLEGAKTILEFIKNQKDKKILIIFAMLQDKDYQGFIKIIAQKTDYLFISKIENETKSQDPKKILQTSKQLKINSEIVENTESAFLRIKKIISEKEDSAINNSFKNSPKKSLKNSLKNSLENSAKEYLTIICGSLYQAGNFIEKNQ